MQFGQPEMIGSLEIGKKADLILVDAAQPHMTPLYHPISHLVYAAGGGDVRTVIINGSVVMEKGRVTTIDVDALFAEIESIARNIQPLSQIGSVPGATVQP